MWHRASFRVTTDPRDVDRAALLALLRTTRWAADLARETLDRALQHSLTFAAMEDDRLVGFARVVSDRATFAYLCDVVVAESYRGRGLGRWLVECVLAHPELQGLRRFSLVTGTARGLYERFGFSTDMRGLDYMERRAAPVTTT